MTTSRSAKGANARHQSGKELTGPLGGALNIAPVLRVFLKRRVGFVAIASLWAAGVGAGMVWLMRYSLAPAPASQAVAHWPASRITRAGPATLVLAVHPYCPCTDASLEELSRILAKCRDRLSVRLLFYRPSDQPSSWTRTALWRTAARLPATQLFDDVGATEALRFGLVTSGEAALYDAHGELVFRGGITSARGHAGDNYGADAIVDFANANLRPRSTTPVFGCSLLSPDTVRNPELRP